MYRKLRSNDGAMTGMAKAVDAPRPHDWARVQENVLRPGTAFGGDLTAGGR